MPASCKGQVLQSDVAGGQLLVQCLGAEPSRMALYGLTRHIDFTEEAPADEGDRIKPRDRRFFESRDALIDLKRQTAHHLEQAKSLGQYQGRVLLLRENQLALYDSDTNKESVLVDFKYFGGLVDQAGSMRLLRILSAAKAPLAGRSAGCRQAEMLRLPTRLRSAQPPSGSWSKAPRA